MARCLVGVFFIFLLGGCRLGVRQEENVYKDLIKGFDELTGSLTRVMDESTAQDARERLKKLAPRLQDLKQQKDYNDRLVPDAKLVEIRKKYDPILTASITRAVTQHQRVLRTVPSAKPLTDEVATLFQTLNVAQKDSPNKR